MNRVVLKIDGAAHALEFDPAAPERFRLDDAAFAASVATIKSGWYSILIAGKNLELRVAAVEGKPDGGPATYRVSMDGAEFSIEVIDPRKWVRGGGAAQAAGSQSIVAPMPGKVVRILVAEGQSVEAGQGLLVVEAMKMQNEIKSQKAGTVGKVSVHEGQTVTAGQALMIVE